MKTFDSVEHVCLKQPQMKMCLYANNTVVVPSISFRPIWQQDSIWNPRHWVAATANLPQRDAEEDSSEHPGWVLPQGIRNPSLGILRFHALSPFYPASAFSLFMPCFLLPHLLRLDRQMQSLHKPQILSLLSSFHPFMSHETYSFSLCPEYRYTVADLCQKLCGGCIVYTWFHKMWTYHWIYI